MKLHTLLLVALVGLATVDGMAATKFPATGQTRITAIYGRNQGAGLTLPAGDENQGFAFAVNTPESACGNPVSTLFLIPKQDPAAPANENPAYRDYVSMVLFAFSLNRPVVVYYDICVVNGTIPRLVGMDVYP